MYINRNVGGFDRYLRTGVSLLMIYFGFFSDAIISDAVAGSILGFFGLASMAIVLFAFCPLYSAIGYSTYNKGHKRTPLSPGE